MFIFQPTRVARDLEAYDMNRRASRLSLSVETKDSSGAMLPAREEQATLTSASKLPLLSEVDNIHSKLHPYLSARGLELERCPIPISSHTDHRW